MLKMLTTKNKILIPMVILTLILMFIGGIVTYINYSKILSLKTLNNKILFSSEISTLLHTLQIERGLSCAFVTDNDDKFKQDILFQRKITDLEINNLQNFLSSLSCKNLKKETDTILHKLLLLPNLRHEIDNREVTDKQIIKYYSRINSLLLNIIVTISKSSHIPIITQNILAYSNFLYLKEYMGIERAEGVTIFSTKRLDKKSLIKFVTTLSMEKNSENMFLQYASNDIKVFYKNQLQEESFLDVSSMENSILYKKIKKIDVDSKEWFTTITRSLNSLDEVSTMIKQESKKNIQIELKHLNKIFIFLTGLIILSLFTFILMLVAFFKLARQEQRLRVVMDKYIISSTTNLNGKIIDVSEAFCTISGYTRAELLGKPHSIVRHPDTPDELFRDMWYRLLRGLSWSGKVKNKRKNGSFYWVYANVEPLFTSTGEIDSYISIRLDITESELLLLKIEEEEEKNKKQEVILREQSRLIQMGEMINMIAHQWRQPLSAIAAAAGALHIKAQRNRLTQETTIDIANKIKGFSLHLSSTIDDFRNFFKTNKVKTDTNFQTVLQSVLSIVEGSLHENKIIFNIIVKDIEDFYTFENELKQVVLNLIKNAEDALIDSSTEKPKIDILLSGKSFTISDNAGGVPENIIDKIFDPYFSTKTQKDGTGLGLYMSKMIIHDHCNGQISVQNIANGAQFTISLGNNND
jgi:PAS domain S-box-containing protein